MRIFLLLLLASLSIAADQRPLVLSPTAGNPIQIPSGSRVSLPTSSGGFFATIDPGAQTATRVFTLPVTAGGDTLDVLGTATTLTALKTFTGGATFNTAGLTVTDINIALGTTTGTKFGTATSQKLAFYNSTPVIQQSGDVATALSTLGLVATPTVSATSALDGTFLIKNTADNTKQFAWSLGGLTTGKVVTLAPVNTVSGTLTIPSFGTSDTLPTLGQASQTFSGINIFSGSTSASNTQTGVIVQNGGASAISVGIGQGNIWSGGNIICGGKMSVGIAGVSQTLSINSAGNVIFELQQAGTTIGYLANGSAIFSGASTTDMAFNCNTSGKKVILGNAGVRGLEVVDGTANFPGSTDATAIGTAGVTFQGGATFAKTVGIGSASAPGSPFMGQIWNDSTRQQLMTFAGSSTANGIKQCLPGVLFTSNTNSGAGPNATTSATSLFPAGVGTKTLPANFLTAGKQLRIHMRGTISNGGGGTFTILVTLGGTTISTTGAVTPTGALSSNYWEGDWIAMCQSTGVSGLVDCRGHIIYANGQTAQILVCSSNAAINTTTSQALDITAQTSVGPSNSMFCIHADVEVLN